MSHSKGTLFNIEDSFVNTEINSAKKKQNSKRVQRVCT